MEFLEPVSAGAATRICRLLAVSVIPSERDKIVLDSQKGKSVWGWERGKHMPNEDLG